MRTRQWTIAVVLLVAGVALMYWARDYDGWDQAWRLDVGAALALLAPLYFLEELLRARVAELSRRASESAQSYDFLRRLLPAGDERTELLDSLIDAIRDQMDGENALTPHDVEVLKDGDPSMRAIALGAMRGDHTLIDERVLVESIARSRTGFEQYHALLLADESWAGRSDATRRKILEAIEQDRKGFIADDPHRVKLAADIRRRA